MKYRIVYFYAKLDKIKDIKGHITHFYYFLYINHGKFVAIDYFC